MVRYSKSGPWSFSFHLFGSLILTTLPFLGCTLKGNIDDISTAQVSFSEPSSPIYINKTNYNFKAQINAANVDINDKSAAMEIYESTECDPAKLVSTSAFSVNGMVGSSAVVSLQDGKRYTARIIVKSKDKTFQSECSKWVGVDLQSPNPVAVSYPPNNTYVAVKELTTAWSNTTDNGIAGLSDVPYRLRLYGQAACAGPILQTADAAEQQYKFKKLTQGMTYSVQISAVDKAGNESVLSCSPYTEVDIYAPGIHIYDLTSADGYSRVLNPSVTITNDAGASYWCITPDTNFVPSSYINACPSGNGSVNGWYTSRPTTETLSPPDGLKTYNLWVVRGDGSLISNKKTSAAITLDQTLPGNFAVTGIGGATDSIFDAWLTSSGNPTVRWSPSTDATDYTVEIRTLSNSLVCSQSGVPASPQEMTFNSCASLVNGQTYKIRMIAYDVARNFITAPDFNFTVDRSVPGNFSISGVLGGADTIADAFLGAGLPIVQYSLSAGTTSHYLVTIKDASGSSTVCTTGDQPTPGGSFNYATEGGVSCSALTHGATYRVYVTALTPGGAATAASNNGFSFQVDTVAPVLTITSQPSALTSDTFADFAFTATDALSGVDKVQCRLDGGAYADCTSPVNLTGVAEGLHTYDVKAVDMVGNVTTKSVTWRIDLSNPVLTILSQPPAYTNTLAIGVSFTATDASGIAGYSCGLDGAALTSCSSPLNFVTTEGPHNLIVRATDNMGYYDEKTVSFFADLTNPILNITSQPPPYTTDPHVSIGFSATDAAGIAGYTCNIDGGGAASCTSPLTFTASEGAHTVVVRATDNTGYFDEKTVTFRVDTTNPVLTITAQPLAHTTNPNAWISFVATDAAGIASYECSIDGAGFSLCTSPVTFTATEGPHTVVVRATDNTGFYDEKTVNFVVDTTNPVLTINSQPSAYTTSTSASIAFSATDADGIAGYTCSIDGAGAGACTSPLNFTAAEGVHTVVVRATDLAGLYDEKLVTFRVDNTNPILTITGQPPAYSTNTSAAVYFMATDAAGIAGFTCKIDGAVASACTSPLSFAAAEGNHSVVVKVTDNTGLTDTKTVNFVVDLTNPVVTLTAVPSNPSHSVSTGSFSFTIADANPTTATCRVDGGAATACSSPMTFSGLGAGSHTAVITATDGAGNSGSQSYTWTIYTYTWTSPAWGGCSVGQPNWSTGGWYGCTAPQPAWAYGGWGGCSASCGGGVMYRSQWCPVNYGTEYRSVTCPTVWGTQTRVPQCQRNDGTIVVDTYCDAGSKPATSQSCSRGGGTDCAGGQPGGTQTCQRGGGSDCNSPQATSASCNTQSCVWHNIYTYGYNGVNCSSYGGVWDGGVCYWVGTTCSLYDGKSGYTQYRCY